MEIRGYRFDRQELSGALGDLGTFLPLAIALITVNGINASSVFLAAGLLYLGAGVYYKIPMPVQPLKATSVIAITMMASPQVVAATALSMGIIFMLVRCFDLNETLNRLFPRPIIRGIQLSLGMILAKKGFGLFLDRRFLGTGLEMTINLAGMAVPMGIIVGLIAVVLLFSLQNSRRVPAGLAVISFGIVLGVLFSGPVGNLDFSWEAPAFILPRWSDFAVALPVLLLPQLPLTFANSIMATTETAEQYFSEESQKTHPRALFTSLGLANLFAGFIGGIPMCHGSGGLTAHHRFGARSGGASIIIGGIFIFVALILGKSATVIFSLLPLSILGVMLIYIGVSHTLLIKDIMHNSWELTLAVAMAAITMLQGSMALAFALGVPVCFMFNRSRLLQLKC